MSSSVLTVNARLQVSIAHSIFSQNLRSTWPYPVVRDCFRSWQEDLLRYASKPYPAKKKLHTFNQLFSSLSIDHSHRSSVWLDLVRTFNINQDSADPLLHWIILEINIFLPGPGC